MNSFHTSFQTTQSAPTADRRIRLGFAAASLCTTLLLFQGVAMLASPAIEPQAMLAGASQPPGAIPTATAPATANASVDNWKQSTVAQAGTHLTGKASSSTALR